MGLVVSFDRSQLAVTASAAARAAGSSVGRIAALLVGIVATFGGVSGAIAGTTQDEAVRANPWYYDDWYDEWVRPNWYYGDEEDVAFFDDEEDLGFSPAGPLREDGYGPYDGAFDWRADDARFDGWYGDAAEDWGAWW